MAIEDYEPNMLLKQARDNKEWSQQELADKLGVDVKTVSRWESGVALPRPYALQKLCSVFGMTAEQLGFGPKSSNRPLTSSVHYIFLSYYSDDANHPLFKQFMKSMKSHEISFLDDRRARLAGKKVSKHEYIKAAKAVLIITSPETPKSSNVSSVLNFAKNCGCPVLALWIAGKEWEQCWPQDREKSHLIVDAREGNQKEVDELIIELKKFLVSSDKSAHGSTESLTASEPRTEVRNPYKGLKAFQDEDQGDFFGRDAFIHELLTKLEETLQTDKSSGASTRLLAILGASGSGKSSVLMAGLLPELQKSGAIPNSKHWIYLPPITPGSTPLDELARVLASHFPEKSSDQIKEEMEEETTGIWHSLATAIAPQPETKVVLAVDQFEEVFTLTHSQEDREQFLDLLIAACTEPNIPVLVILTMRIDFYERLIAYPELVRFVKDHQELILPMTLNDLREVVEKPAALVGVTFEENLVADLIFEVLGEPEALPLLEFTLDELFRRRRGSVITRQVYEELGGVKGALVKHANFIYESLPPDQHSCTREIFRRLIDPGTTKQDTARRRVEYSVFETSDATETAVFSETIKRFVQARLLTRNYIGGKSTVEVSHEALIREWGLLESWVDEDREDIRLQQKISDDVFEWERRKQPRDRLYRGKQLKDARNWAKSHRPGEKEEAFLRASMQYQLLRIIMLILILLGLSGGGLTWYLTHLPPNPTLVTSLKDSDVGSLRWCIASAPSGSTITFATNVRGAIKLANNDISIDKNLVIKGPDANLLAISSTGPGFLITSGASVTISGLSFKNSTFSFSSFIISEGNLTVSDSIFSNNKEHVNSVIDPFGSSLTSSSGNLTVRNSTFLNNSADNDGGAIEVKERGRLTVINSTFLNNSAVNDGGAIDNIGSLTVRNSSFSNNSSGHSGGAIDNYINGTLNVTNSSFSNNSSKYVGGAIGNLSYTNVYVANSTFSENMAINTDTNIPTEPGGFGGAIYNEGSLSAVNSTFLNNKADAAGGGIATGNDVPFIHSSTLFLFCTFVGNQASSGGGISMGTPLGGTVSMSVTLENSIVVENSAFKGPDIAGTLTSGGYNLIQNIAGATFFPNGLQLTDKQVQLLSDLKIDALLSNNDKSGQTLVNGGHTQVLKLQVGIPAIDTIPLAMCHITIKDAQGKDVKITTDQLNDPRPDNNENTCDIGAYESSY